MSDETTGPIEAPEPVRAPTPSGTTERITRHLRNDEQPTTTEDAMTTMDPGSSAGTNSSAGTDSSAATNSQATTELPVSPPVAADRPATARSGGDDTTGAWSATTPSAAPPVDQPARNGLRVGTVVWGLVIAAVGIGLLAVAGGVVFDVELALIGLVGAAGLALLVGSLATGMRRRNR